MSINIFCPGAHSAGATFSAVNLVGTGAGVVAGGVDKAVAGAVPGAVVGVGSGGEGSIVPVL